MAIVLINDEIKEILLNSNFSQEFLDNCFNAKFLSIQQIDSKIVGAAFVGGMLNVYGIELDEEFFGRGLWRKLIKEIFSECKRQKISYITGAYKENNLRSIKIHNILKFIPVFTCHYNKKIGKEIAIIYPFTKKGNIVKNLMSFFNTRFGNAVFTMIFVFFRPFLNKIIPFNENKIPEMDLFYSLKKFEKVDKTIKNIESKIKQNSSRQGNIIL